MTFTFSTLWIVGDKMVKVNKKNQPAGGRQLAVDCYVPFPMAWFSILRAAYCLLLLL